MYSSPPHDKQGLVYLLHEMAHYKHVVTLGESGKNNSEIKEKTQTAHCAQ